MKKTLIAAILAALYFGASAQIATTVHVVGISDGDTLTVLTSNKQTIRVRLSDIDAPESDQDFGYRSKEALSRLCFRKSAVIDLGQTDLYGRTISRVTCDGVDVQHQMVRLGMAWVYRHYSKDPDLLKAEAQSKEQKIGLWSHPNPVPPWEYRRNKGEKKDRKRSFWEALFN